MISSKKTFLRTRIADLLFPQSIYCICCGKIIDQTRTYSLCDHCMKRIRWNIEDFDDRKGLPMIRCTEYGLYERTVIFSLKYGGNRYIARSIAEIMRDRIKTMDFMKEPDNIILVPVPLHRDKEKKRGFNQTALITKYLAEETGTQEAHPLERIEKTRPMRALSAEERAINIKNSMNLLPEYRGFADGKTILLIDDFATTGSTLCECARALEEASADRILAMVFAARNFQ
jgi:competence protein ComFC